MGGFTAVVSGRGHSFEVPLNILYHGGWGLSAVAGWVADSCWGSRISFFAPGEAGEAAHYSPRKFVEGCNGLAILYFGGWAGSAAVADDAIHFSPLWQVVTLH